MTVTTLFFSLWLGVITTGVIGIGLALIRLLKLLENFEVHHSHFEHFMSSALAAVSHKVNGREE